MCGPLPFITIFILHIAPPYGAWLINHIDTKSKCRHLKILNCKGILRQVFIEFIYWRYSQSCWYFEDPSLCTVAPLTFSLVQLSPFPCVNKYAVYRYTVYKGGGRYGILGLRQINTFRKVPFQINFFRWHFMSLSLLLRIAKRSAADFRRCHVYWLLWSLL